jgi:hypothetical protein
MIVYSAASPRAPEARKASMAKTAARAMRRRDQSFSRRPSALALSGFFKNPYNANHAVGTPVMAHELGLFDAINESPRGTVVTAHMSNSVRRLARGSRNHSATPEPMKNRMFTNRMIITESSMSGDANQFMTA